MPGNALHSVVYLGLVETAQLLISHGIDVNLPNELGALPITLAVGHGNTEVLRLLVDNGAHVNVTAGSASLLHWTMLKGSEAVVRILLDAGALTEQQDMCGRTPLHIAAQANLTAMIQALLKSGAATSTLDANGRTALHHAGYKNGVEAVQALLQQRGIDADARDRYGSTPLSLAVRHGNIQVIELLLDCSPDVTSQDQFGRSVIWWAVRTGQTEAVQILLGIALSKDTVLEEPNVSPRLATAELGASSISCDVCTLRIGLGQAYHHCEICQGSNFDVCQDCVDMGAVSLDSKHDLVALLA